jgi:hypothetical protein
MEDSGDPPTSVRFLVGPNHNKVLFVVGKESICTSNYFRNLLQPRRKAIEGNCPICQEALEEDVEERVKELTYCTSSCGNNFHQACMDEWKRSKPTGALLQCPMCRQRWDTYTIPAITPKAFLVYYHWLALTYIPLQPWNRDHIAPGQKGPDYIELFEAYQLGVFLSEPKFSKAALQNIVRECKDTNVYPNWRAVDTTYAITSVSSPLRELLVEIYMQFDCLAYE